MDSKRQAVVKRAWVRWQRRMFSKIEEQPNVEKNWGALAHQHFESMGFKPVDVILLANAAKEQADLLGGRGPFHILRTQDQRELQYHYVIHGNPGLEVAFCGHTSHQWAHYHSMKVESPYDLNDWTTKCSQCTAIVAWRARKVGPICSLSDGTRIYLTQDHADVMQRTYHLHMPYAEPVKVTGAQFYRFKHFFEQEEEEGVGKTPYPEEEMKQDHN